MKIETKRPFLKSENYEVHMKEKIRKEIRFSGDVQGVGFRYRAQHAAQSLGVTGWVHNEWDGSVLMQAQGTEEEIVEMIRLISMSLYIGIKDISYKIIEVDEAERGFHIR